MIRTYKYRIKDRSGRNALLKYAYGANQVWNWCVAYQRDIDARYHAGAPKRRWPTHFDLTKLCNGTGALLGINQQTVQEICRQFAQSRDQHKQCPRFRSSFGQNRARGWVPFSSQSRQLKGNCVTYLGKRFRFWEGGRAVPEMATGGAFIEDARGNWYVTFYLKVEDYATTGKGEIGIDLGLKALATISTGETIKNPRHMNRHARSLATTQRAGNKRRAKAIHVKISNARRDFHHKVSTRLAREHAFIAVGNIDAKKLAKTRMAKSVLDAGWSSFRFMLRYKAASFVEVDEKFTTQTCSSCGALPSKWPKGTAGLGIRAWQCSDCGASHDRDVNAARNILALARSAPRPAEESRKAPGRRQSDKHEVRPGRAPK